MTLLISDDDFAKRSIVARRGLAALGESLAADLERVIERPLFIPEQKALLSREGGRCPKDGAMLEFDPFSPQSHRCPVCGTAYTGELHDLFWNYWYQLWLAERAVHGALLGALGVLPRGTDFARSVLDAYCDLYPRYPNVDNALGPTRPFFSTYLESIWLLQLSVAVDLLDRAEGAGAVAGRFKDVVVSPSASIIASYDEGMSNRQVWNNAALMAAHRVLGRDERAESIVWAESGLVSHLSNALLPDGTWYEGENYHLFAHRGLWYAVQMCEAAGFELMPEFVARYDRGFVTPLLTSLPDLTFPSRRDSQYAISLRQWRFAEMCELGLARRGDRVLAGMLGRLYAEDTSRGETGRWKSSAEAERNLPPTALSRSDLGWKSLLVAKERFSPSEGGAIGSVLLEAQGIGVLRRDDDRVYVGLDYGISGGGHGHPDRLNLLLMDGDRRILDDMGTGSYVDPSLHWYRSTLAHNAPMFDGRSQQRVDGDLVAFEDRGGAGWISASAAVAQDAGVTRTIVAMPDYVVDEVSWTSPSSRIVDLPLHVDVAGQPPVSGAGDTLSGSQGAEDGFRFLRDVVRVRTIAANETAQLQSADVDLWVGAESEVEVWRATADGPPGKPPKSFLILRTRTASGVIRGVWSWKRAVRSVELFPKPVVSTIEAKHEHSRVEHGWQVAMHVGGARSSIDLEGLARRAGDRSSGDFLSQRASQERKVHGTMTTPGQSRTYELGEEAYRRSEQTWEEAGRPTARLSVTNDRGVILLRAEVDAARSFVPPGAVNRLDNEQADINGAGLQLYLSTGAETAGYVIVPVASRNALSIRPIDGWGDGIEVRGTWAQSQRGYIVELELRPQASMLMLDVIVNEKPMGRERRRGQLVLSDMFFPEKRREFVYLAGDRNDASWLVPFLLKHDE